MRLFVAINFNDATRGRLVALRDELRSRSGSGNFSSVENMHLTLAFLGECDAGQAAAAKSAMDATPFEAFPIIIEDVGRFRRDGGDIWWVGVQAAKPLMDLQRRLAARLAEKGFALDSRKYSPHITLGREVVTNVAPWQAEPFGEDVESVELMKSERINGKLTYTAIYRIICESRN